MKKKNDNVCKFVTNYNSQQLFTTNFVYECKKSGFEKMSIEKNNTMCLAVSGKGRLCTELFKKDLQPGMIFFTFAGTSHCIENIKDFEFIYITFNGQRSQELFKRFGISPACCVFKGHEGLLVFWQNCLGKANEKNLDLISESVLLYTFAEMSPPDENDEQYLTGDILEYIKENFTDSSLTLASTAEDLGYNPKYISRIFKKNMGITFSEYIKNTRIQHAIFLMDQGVTAVQNVALLSGYRDPFYFSNVFRQTIGMSPSEFIKRKQENGEEIMN